MRILHVSGTFLPVKGGGPYFVHYLSKHLERRGHSCRVVTTDVGGSPDTETVASDRASAITLAGAPIGPGFPLVLERAIRSFDPDVVHANYPLPLYPDVTAALCSIRDLPLVVTCHGAFETSLDSLVGVFGAVYNRTLLPLTLRTAERIHVSNSAILDAFDFYRSRREKTSVIPIGVDTEWFTSDAVDGGPPFPDTDEPTVLFVGALRRYKGLEYLLAAFADVDDAQLVLIGDGPKRARLVELATEYGVSDVVTFLGHVDDNTLRNAYAHADVFVLPSPSIRESLGMVALEAMAMGVPTVVTSGSGIGSMLEDETAGVVVESADSGALAAGIRSVIRNPEHAALKRTAGRNLVESRFDWSVLVDEYVELYEMVK